MINPSHGYLTYTLVINMIAYIGHRDGDSSYFRFPFLFHIQA